MSFEQSQVRSFDRKRTIVEYVEGCEDAIADFFSGRSLVSQTEPTKEQKLKHEKKYSKEVEYDAKETANGFPIYKKYREDLVNNQSKCTAQFINNLNTYYGDGSRLQECPKPHYAVDLVHTIGLDSADTSILKTLEVSRRKVSRKFIENTFVHSPLSSRLRRSFSCIDFFFEITEEPREEKALSSFEERKNFEARKDVICFNFDSEFEIPPDFQNVSPTVMQNELHWAFDSLVTRTNAPESRVGELEISKVLFTTDDWLAYIIPKKHDTERTLKTFSQTFKMWWLQLSQLKRDTFGSFRSKQFGPNKSLTETSAPYWLGVNVVLFLPEYDEEGTMFRRARHILDLPSPNPARKALFVELDTGNLRSVACNKNTVRRLPQEHANEPPAIMQVCMKEGTNVDDFTRDINTIRRMGRALIVALKTGNRRKIQEFYSQNDMKGSSHNWNEVQTLVLTTCKEYPTPLLSNLFCEDRDCMGLCCTEAFQPNSSIKSPISINAAATTPSYDDAENSKRPGKFFHGEMETYLEPGEENQIFPSNH